MKYSISLGLPSRTDPVFLVFLHHIAQSMTGNTGFPNATAILTRLIAATSVYSTAIDTAQRGGQGTLEARKKARATCEKEIKLLASHVEDNSIDDLQKLQTSGFEVRKQGSNQPATLGVISNFQLRQIRGGIVIGKFKRAPNSTITEIRFRIVGDIEWSANLFCSSSDFEIIALKPATEYEVNIRAIGKSQKRSTADTTAWITETVIAI
jgi:hypothetical protein